MRQLRIVLAAAVLGAVSVSVGACGGGSSSTATSTAGASAGAGRQVTLEVGTLPIAADAPLYLGIKKGFFAREGLEIQAHSFQGGAAVVPAIISGSIQVGWSNCISTLLAAGKGLPLRVVAIGDAGGSTKADDYAGLVVPKGSPIRTPQQLEGATIAVNTLNNIETVTIRAALDKLGVDTSKLHFTEVAFPDMPAALASHRVDAAFPTEPFWTIAKAAGARTIVEPYVTTRPDLMVAQWVSSSSYVQAHEDTMRHFVAAIGRSNRYAQRHPRAVRAVLSTYTKIKPQVAKVMRLPQWSTKVDKGSLTLLDRLARKFGVYEQPVDVDSLVPGPGGAS